MSKLPPSYEYVPEVFEGKCDGTYGTVAISIVRCSQCKAPTPPFMKEWTERTLFPRDFRSMLDAQMKRAGWKRRSTATSVEGKELCVECAEEHARFKCALCDKVRSGEPKESYGVGRSDSEYLCMPCYETVSAKTWDAKVTELEEAHRYDYE